VSELVEDVVVEALDVRPDLLVRPEPHDPDEPVAQERELLVVPVRRRPQQRLGARARLAPQRPSRDTDLRVVYRAER
jgi:hypothetical protein